MNILVLEIPALRLDYLGCYGNEWVATPNLDRLASEGIVLDRHFADDLQSAGGTRPRQAFPARPTSQPSNLFDLLDHAGVFAAPHDLGALEILTASTRDVLERWRCREASLLWLSTPALAPPWRLSNDMLAAYCDDDEVEPLPEPAIASAGPLTEDDELLRVQDTYAAVVTFVDAQVGTLLDWLDEEGLRERTLVCVTSSVGLSLGEHGPVGAEDTPLHEEVIHLPLVLRLPAGEGAGLRVAALTQPADLLPTIFEALGVSSPACDGRSLWPFLREQPVEPRPYVCSARGTEWLLRTRSWTFLLSLGQGADQESKRRLYLKPEDRWEVNDVRQPQLELADAAEKTLRAFMEAAAREGALEYPPLE